MLGTGGCIRAQSLDIIHGEDIEAKVALAKDADTTPGELYLLAQDSNVLVHHAVVRHKMVSREVLMLLADSTDTTVLWAIGKNEDTPREALKKILSRPASAGTLPARAVAANPALGPELFKMAYELGDNSVRQDLLGNTAALKSEGHDEALVSELIRYVCQRRNPEVFLYNIASDMRLGPEDTRAVCAAGDHMVLSALIENYGACGSSIVEYARETNDVSIQMFLAHRMDVPVEEFLWFKAAFMPLKRVKEYLRHHPSLDMVLALINEWQGTLGELIETVENLDRV